MTVAGVAGKKICVKFIECHEKTEKAPAKETKHLPALWLKGAIEKSITPV